MPACPPFELGYQLRHEDSTVVFRSSGLDDAIEFPILQYTTVAAARELGMSQRTFHRKFHALTGENYRLWVSRQRLERAKNLLRETDLNIEQITEACGFASSGSLRRVFRDSTDGSPSEYRKTHSRRT